MGFVYRVAGRDAGTRSGDDLKGGEMGDTFTASNGVTVESFGSFGESYIRVSGVTLDDAYEGVALREFFQHERDKELGRWRWPEKPDYVVYPTSVLTRVCVLHETKSPGVEWVDAEDGGLRYDYQKAAKAYFAAHHEPKPWHDAKPGEVWVLTVDGSEYAWGVGTGVDVGRFRFVGGESNIPVTSADITAGRKIWPEAPND